MEKTKTPTKEKAASSRSNKDWPALADTLYDNRSKKAYRRGAFIGEGGFAKCYEAVEVSSNEIYCCKAIWKKAIRNENEKLKIRSEIRINGALTHPHIVKLHSCFEDDNYVYIILEMCEKKSMMELLKRRKRLTEEETRYYMLQIIDGMEYCLSKRIIHRDLKLGNIFITKDMNLKIGDFGLAAQLTDKEDRKKTICGTPNYIAPEVLFNKEGHSFSADMWSIGVIIYTLLIGIPPFQTSSTKKLYNKIKHSDFSFPEDKPISAEARDIINRILNTEPKLRPNFEDLRNHAFFKSGFTPSTLPLECLFEKPDFDKIKEQKSLIEQVTKIQQIKIETKKEEAIVKEKRELETQVKGDRQYHRPLGTVNGMIWNSKPGEDPRKNSPQFFNKPPSTPIKAEGAKPELSHVDATDSKSKMSSETLVFEEIIATIDKITHHVLNGLPTDKIEAEYAEVENKEPNFISKWVDHGDQYGLGFELSDTTSGIFFKDSTTMIMAPDQKNIEYLYYPPSPVSVKIQCEHLTVDNVPANLYKKYKIFQKYSNYMKEKLSNAMIQNKLPINYKREESVKNKATLPYITKFLRTRRATLFRLSNKVVQMNFKADHYKLILSQKGYMLSVINQHGVVQNFRLIDILTSYNLLKGQVKQKTKLPINTDYNSTPIESESAIMIGQGNKELDYNKVVEYLEYVKGVLKHVVQRKQATNQNLGNEIAGVKTA